MRTALVTGFGSFPGVDDNPTAHLARAVDGRVVAGVRIVGRVLPVAWERGPAEAVALARSLDAAWVLGLGVAVGRAGVEVETLAVNTCDDRPDADGVCVSQLLGPEVVRSTLDCSILADALGAGLSRDAGRYVCNAWLYQVTRALEVPVGFVHVPARGLELDVLLRGLAALC